MHHVSGTICAKEKTTLMQLCHTESNCLLTATHHGHMKALRHVPTAALYLSTCVTLGLTAPPHPPNPVCVLQVTTDRDQPHQCSSGSIPCSPCPLTQAHAAFVIPTYYKVLTCHMYTHVRLSHDTPQSTDTMAAASESSGGFFQLTITG